MALPGSRDFTAVDGGPLSAATVNNIQDSIVALEANRLAGKHGPITLSVPASAADLAEYVGVSPVMVFSGSVWQINSTGGSAGPSYPLPMPVGGRLISWSLWCLVLDAADSFIAQAARPFIPSVNLQGASQSTSSLVAVEIGQTFGTPLSLSAGEHFMITTARGGPANNHVRCGTATYTFDVP